MARVRVGQFLDFESVLLLDVDSMAAWRGLGGVCLGSWHLLE